jgi:HNH endonuclease
MSSSESYEYLIDLYRTSKYEVYLATNHWQTLRERALESQGRACRRCGATRALHVHHRTYERIGRELLEDLEVLCATCHQRRHPTRRVGADRKAAGDGDDEHGHVSSEDEPFDAHSWWHVQTAEWADNVYEAPAPGETIVETDRALEDR